MFRRSYHRISDDSVSSFSGHETLEAAIKEAEQILKDFDVDHVWVRDVETNQVVFDAQKT